MSIIYEYPEGSKFAAGDRDGMAQFLIEDIPFETDLDIVYERAPHAHYIDEDPDKNLIK